MFTAFIFQTILKNVQMNMRHKRDQQQFETSKCQFRNSENTKQQTFSFFPRFYNNKVSHCTDMEPQLL